MKHEQIKMLNVKIKNKKNINIFNILQLIIQQHCSLFSSVHVS